MEFFFISFWVILLSSIALIVIKKNIKEEESDKLATGKDMIFYTGLFLTLCFSVSAFLSIVFSAIDKMFPDVLSYNYSYTIDQIGLQSEQAMTIATLLVTYPLYLYFAYGVARDLRENNAKRNISIRKAVIYLSMIVSSLTVVGTVISTLYMYLMGSLLGSFLLKAFVVLTISIVLFSYFYFSLKRDYSKPTQLPNFLAIFASIFVFGFIVWSINIFGTPAEARVARIDEKKIQDLMNINSTLKSKFTIYNNNDSQQQSYYALPKSLDSISNHVNILDSETEKEYSYKRINDTEYQLCANFESERRYSKNNYTYKDWSHDKGEHCFDFSLDDNKGKEILTLPYAKRLLDANSTQSN